MTPTAFTLFLSFPFVLCASTGLHNPAPASVTQPTLQLARPSFDPIPTAEPAPVATVADDLRFITRTDQQHNAAAWSALDKFIIYRLPWSDGTALITDDSA